VDYLQRGALKTNNTATGSFFFLTILFLLRSTKLKVLISLISNAKLLARKLIDFCQNKLILTSLIHPDNLQ